MSLLGLAAVAGQEIRATTPTNLANVQVRSFRIHPDANVYMLAGAGSNVTVQFGNDGVLVVDTEYEPMADRLLAEIKRLAGDRVIRYVVNTHSHLDHVGGNAKFRAAGQTILAGNVAMDIRDSGATIIAHEQTQVRMAQPGIDGQVPPSTWLPTETFFTDKMSLSFNDEAVELLHVPAAHTDGDVMVFFRKSDVISTGDVFITTTYPIIDVARGGTINGIVAALNRIIDITEPRDKQEGGTMVIPGHGRICDEADVVEYRDMITIIRDRVQSMIKKGMTLEQVKAARPTSDYDGRWGATSGIWTTEMFVEAAYRTLSQPRTNGQTRATP
jgi:glyoxylase-like metal-dependent hydrolase (beta-lactamase superfamily II)